MKKTVILTWVQLGLLLAGLAGFFLFPDSSIRLLLMILAAFVIGCFSLAFLYQQKRIMDFLQKEKNRYRNVPSAQMQKEEKRMMDMQIRQLEMLFLQSQINPHFLYNTLDSIRSKALLEGQKEIADMTEILSNYFRYCISNTDNLVKVREELLHVKDYIYIQKFRFEDRFDIQIHLEEESIKDLYLPKMTIQPLIENAMTHGLEKVGRKGLIDLRLFRVGNELHILVSDNGSGMNGAELEKMNEKLKNSSEFHVRTDGRHTGIAIPNINARIKMTFGDQYGIRYRSILNQGTDAEVVLPVVDDFNRMHYLEEMEWKN